MSLQEKLDALKKISDIAALSGIKGKIDENRMSFIANFILDGNRNQFVHIRLTGKNQIGGHIVTFFSPCLKVKKGFLKGITKDQAIDLLRRNEKTLFARYGVWSLENEELVVASIDHILDTLDPEEFKTSSWHVAIAADRYEKEHGKDDF